MSEYQLGSAAAYGMQVALYEGHIWPDWSIGYFDKIRDFALDDSDVIVVGYEKSGTNWTQIMITNLFGWENWGTTAVRANHSVPTLENGGDFELCDNASTPRLMKSHLWREAMPARWPEHGKVVHITRNPKDVCVSFFEELVYTRGMEMSWDDWVKAFAEGRTVHGPYVDNVLSWTTYEHPNLIHLRYEDMKADTLFHMRRVAEFLNRPFDEKRLEQVVEESQFDNMKNSELQKQYAGMFRKGIVGDWQERFSPEQSELFDRMIDSKLRARGVELSYEAKHQ